jgi:hypothetical protein
MNGMPIVWSEIPMNEEKDLPEDWAETIRAKGPRVIIMSEKELDEFAEFVEKATRQTVEVEAMEVQAAMEDAPADHKSLQ